MDGNGALFGTLCGNTRDVLHRFTVDLPKKHGNGNDVIIKFKMYEIQKLAVVSVWESDCSPLCASS